MTRNHISLIESLSFYCHYLESVYVPLLTLLCIFVLLIWHGDIKLNLAPRKLMKNFLSICHWNLNSLNTHDFSKLMQFKVLKVQR